LAVVNAVGKRDIIPSSDAGRTNDDPCIRHIRSMTEIGEQGRFILVMFAAYAGQTTHERGWTSLVARTGDQAIDRESLQRAIDAAVISARQNGIKSLFVYGD
jgi:hypothetical protein